MAKKKTSMQLDREIATALASKRGRGAKACTGCGGKGRASGCRQCGVMSGRRAEISHATKKEPSHLGKPSSKAVDFFRKLAGYSMRPGESKAKAKTRMAQALARAEAEAEARGWTVDWDDDPEEWQGDVERPFEVLNATLRDSDGHVLGSLGGNGMTGNRKTDSDYRRVIEAELADEALG